MGFINDEVRIMKMRKFVRTIRSGAYESDIKGHSDYACPLVQTWQEDQTSNRT